MKVSTQAKSRRSIRIFRDRKIMPMQRSVSALCTQNYPPSCQWVFKRSSCVENLLIFDFFPPILSRARGIASPYHTFTNGVGTQCKRRIPSTLCNARYRDATLHQALDLSVLASTSQYIQVLQYSSATHRQITHQLSPHPLTRGLFQLNSKRIQFACGSVTRYMLLN